MVDPASCPHARIRKQGALWLCSSCGAQVEPGQSHRIAWQHRRWAGLPLHGLLVWGVSLLAAMLIGAWLPFLWFISITLATLFHECGHALAGLLTGHPAIPSFDLIYGGGVTTIYGRSVPLFLAMLGLVGWGAWRWREVPKLAIPLGLLALVQLVLVLTGWDEAVIVAMGPTGTVVASTIFLARAITGEADIYPGERWIYGVVGWLMLGDVASLCWHLTYDPAAIEHYYEGKGGIDNDLVRLAEDHLGTTLPAVVRGAFVVCCLAPLAALGWCWYRKGLIDDQLVRQSDY